jgi:hypothetical protein
MFLLFIKLSLLIVLIILIYTFFVKINKDEVWLKERFSVYRKTLNKWRYIINPLCEKVIKVNISTKYIELFDLDFITEDKISIKVNTVMTLNINSPSKFYYQNIKTNQLNIISNLLKNLIAYFVSREKLLNIDSSLNHFKKWITEKLKDTILKSWLWIIDIKLDVQIPENIKKTIDSNKDIVDDFFMKVNKDVPNITPFTLKLSLWNYLFRIYDNIKITKDDEINDFFFDIISEKFDKWQISINKLSLTKIIGFNIDKIVGEYKEDLYSHLDMQWIVFTEQIDKNLMIKIKNHCFDVYINMDEVVKWLYSIIRLWDPQINENLKIILNKEIKKYWISVNNIEIIKKDINLKLDDIVDVKIK